MCSKMRGPIFAVALVGLLLCPLADAKESAEKEPVDVQELAKLLCSILNSPNIVSQMEQLGKVTSSTETVPGRRSSYTVYEHEVKSDQFILKYRSQKDEKDERSFGHHFTLIRQDGELFLTAGQATQWLRDLGTVKGGEGLLFVINPEIPSWEVEFDLDKRDKLEISWHSEDEAPANKTFCHLSTGD